MTTPVIIILHKFLRSDGYRASDFELLLRASVSSADKRTKKRPSEWGFYECESIGDPIREVYKVLHAPLAKMELTYRDIARVQLVTHEEKNDTRFLFVLLSSKVDVKQLPKLDSLAWSDLGKLLQLKKRSDVPNLERIAKITNNWLGRLFASTAGLASIKAKPLCDRIIGSEVNPAREEEIYRQRRNSNASAMNANSSSARQHALNEVMAKMVALEKPDIAHINPTINFCHNETSTDAQAMDMMTRVWKMDRMLPEVQSPYRNFNVSTLDKEKFPLQYLAAVGDIQSLIVELDYSHDPSATLNSYCGNGYAPLHWAVWHACNSDRAKVVQQLLARQLVDVNKLTNDGSGFSALHIAVDYGATDIVNLILQGGYPKIDVNIVDASGKTPLDLARDADVESRGAAQLIRDYHYPEVPVGILGEKKLAKARSNHGHNTTAADILQQVLKTRNLDPGGNKLFALWLYCHSIKLQLEPQFAMRKVTSSDEVRRFVQQLTGVVSAEVERPTLCVARNALLTLRQERELYQVASGSARYLLFADAAEHFLAGHFPSAAASSFELTRLLAMVWLRATPQTAGHQTNWKRLQVDSVPVPLHSEQMIRKLKQFATERHINEPEAIIQARFLSECRNLPEYGSTFFSALLIDPVQPKHILLGVNATGLFVLCPPSLQPLWPHWRFHEFSVQHKLNKHNTLEVKHSGRPDKVVFQVKQATTIVWFMNKLERARLAS